MKKIEADSVIFDLDGTMWDSLDGLTRAWDRIAGEHGYPGVFTFEAMKGLMGFTEKDIVDKYTEVFGEETGPIVSDCLDRGDGSLEEDCVVIYEGLAETLAELSSRKPLFLVSNCKTSYMDRFLDISGCRKYFTSCVCEGTYGMPKAENIMRICSDFGLKTPVYVGDTIKDEKASRKAGVQFIHANYGFGTAEAPDAVISCISQLPGVVK